MRVLVIEGKEEFYRIWWIQADYFAIARVGGEVQIVTEEEERPQFPLNSQ